MEHVAWIWDVAGASGLAGLADHALQVRDVLLTPDDGSVLSASRDSAAKIWGGGDL